MLIIKILHEQCKRLFIRGHGGSVAWCRAQMLCVEIEPGAMKKSEQQKRHGQANNAIHSQPSPPPPPKPPCLPPLHLTFLLHCSNTHAHTHTKRGVGWNDNTLAPHPTSCLPDTNTHTLAQPHGCIYSYRQKRKITTRDTAPNPQYTQPLEPLLHIPQHTHKTS